MTKTTENSNNYEVTDNEEKYIRIGMSLYKIVEMPQPDGSTATRRIPWSFRTIQHDYGKGNIPEIKKYKYFCMEPSHLDYKREINGFYNLYEPITHIPKQGAFPCIMKLMLHIFGEQYELGMDYIQLLFTRPLQKLPILLLVSKERNTGKTTFLEFLESVFQENSTIYGREVFRGHKNQWGGRLLVGVDDAVLTRCQEIRSLIETNKCECYKLKNVGREKLETYFFGKFVICTDKEIPTMITDEEYENFWVRKIPPVAHCDADFLGKIKEEIPAFLHYLLYRNLYTTKESCMWFAPSLIRTEDVKRIKTRIMRNILAIRKEQQQM